MPGRNNFPAVTPFADDDIACPGPNCVIVTPPDNTPSTPSAPSTPGAKNPSSDPAKLWPHLAPDAQHAIENYCNNLSDPTAWKHAKTALGLPDNSHDSKVYARSYCSIAAAANQPPDKTTPVITPTAGGLGAVAFPDVLPFAVGPVDTSPEPFAPIGAFVGTVGKTPAPYSDTPLGDNAGPNAYWLIGSFIIKSIFDGLNPNDEPTPGLEMLPEFKPDNRPVHTGIPGVDAPFVVTDPAAFRIPDAYPFLPDASALALPQLGGTQPFFGESVPTVDVVTPESFREPNPLDPFELTPEIAPQRAPPKQPPIIEMPFFTPDLPTPPRSKKPPMIPLIPGTGTVTPPNTVPLEQPQELQQPQPKTDTKDCVKEKEKKKRKPRTVCRAGKYIQREKNTVYTPLRTVPCR